MFQPVPVFVGLRYSLAREHSFFVSFITWVSLLGVALGVAILIVVLSVMNGLGSELRDRLLSVSAHASLNAGGAAIPDWRLRIQQLDGAPELEYFPDTDTLEWLFSTRTSDDGLQFEGKTLHVPLQNPSGTHWSTYIGIR